MPASEPHGKRAMRGPDLPDSCENIVRRRVRWQTQAQAGIGAEASPNTYQRQSMHLQALLQKRGYHTYNGWAHAAHTPASEPHGQRAARGQGLPDNNENIVRRGVNGKRRRRQALEQSSLHHHSTAKHALAGIAADAKTSHLKWLGACF